MKRPVAETSLGGGIWRIKWEPKTGDSILTATMYNGFHVVDSSAIKGIARLETLILSLVF